MRNSYDDSFDYVKEFTDGWNRRVKSIRVAGVVIALMMLVMGVVCIIYPAQSLRVIEILASCLITAVGIYQLIDYCSLPVLFRRAGILINSILNIILGILLLSAPADATIATFAFMFGFLLIIFGVDLLALSGKLRFFGIEGGGWVTATGIISVICAAAFFFLPLASSIAMNIILAVYLVIGGIALLIESVSMKDLKLN